MKSSEMVARCNTFQVDEHYQHVAINDMSLCNDCAQPRCLRVCPAGVFQTDGQRILVLYRQCLECGACRFICPAGNIIFTYPRGGFGIIYRHG